MQRSRKVVVLAHCLLNVNAKVHGIALYPGVHPKVQEWLAGDTGVIQLPCPEVTFLGMARWGMTAEQYAVPAYRRHCRALLEPVVDTLAALLQDGCTITGVWGLDGSPSCGVNKTCEGYRGGDLDALTGPPPWGHRRGPGVFMEELQSLLSDRGLSLPFEAVAEEVI